LPTVTATGWDVPGANCPSPAYCATTESLPPGSKFVVMVAVPPLSTNVGVGGVTLESSNAPIATGEAPDGVAIKETLPVGVPEAEVTFTVKLTVAPCVIVLGEGALIVVVVASKVAVCQAAARLATLTEPSPVALSYPAT